MSAPLTLGSARLDLWETVAESPEDPRFASAMRQVLDRIYNSGQWKGTDKELSVTVGAEGIVTLSSLYKTVLAWRKEGRTGDIHDPWKEWVVGGGGKREADSTTMSAIIDRGLNENGERQYLVPDAVAKVGEQIELKVKLATPQPVNDSDKFYPNNIGALKMGLMAWNFENESDEGRAIRHWNRCYHLLNIELRDHRGPNIMPDRINVWGKGESPIQSSM